MNAAIRALTPVLIRGDCLDFGVVQVVVASHEASAAQLWPVVGHILHATTVVVPAGATSERIEAAVVQQADRTESHEWSTSAQVGGGCCNIICLTYIQTEGHE